MVNGERCKPSRQARPGEMVKIRRGALSLEFVITGLSHRRLGATESAALYRETTESIEARQFTLAQIQANTLPRSHGRPTKKDRRVLQKFKRHGEE